MTLGLTSCEKSANGGSGNSKTIVGQWITLSTYHNPQARFFEVKDGESGSFLIWSFDKKLVHQVYLYGTYENGVLYNAYEIDDEFTSLVNNTAAPYTYEDGWLSTSMSVEVHWVNSDHFYCTLAGTTAHFLRLKEIRYNQNEPEAGGSSSGKSNGHEYVDLGLSVKWATCNVGANSPEGYGNYYAWGETTTKEYYDWSTYFDTNDGGDTFIKYNNEGGKTVLDLGDDAAHVNWGGSWRMPTKAEWQELEDNCTWTWTMQNGINGYTVRSKKEGYTDKFIFLPAAGGRYESDLYNVGSSGGYWSSSLYEYYSAGAWYLVLTLYYHDLISAFNRHGGLSVRAVLP